jgi:peptidoglycan hydrolase-like protein with peptidoglycan-binding domain
MSDVSGPIYHPHTQDDEPTLRRGDGNADGWVEYLQQMLNNRNVGALGVDGYFGEDTYEAVRSFQADNGLAVDGIVGDQTWAALQDEDARLPATDGRPPHSFEEQGPEARWLTGAPIAAYLPDSDIVFLDAVNTGNVSIPAGDFQAVVRITTEDHHEVTGHMPVLASGEAVAPGELLHFGFAQVHTLVGPGTHRIDAYLPAELGGDETHRTFSV